MRSRCDLIPEDTDILLCHSPPRLGSIDRIFGKQGVGSNELAIAITRLNIKAGFYGHIHSARLSEPYSINNGLHYNACTCNEEYKPIYPPILIDL